MSAFDEYDQETGGESEPLFSKEPVLVPANHGKRLANYIIDLVACSFLIGMAMGIVNAVSETSGQQLLQMIRRPISGNLLVSFLYVVLMSIQESLLKGKSLGKLITRTRAVYLDGSLMTTETAFLRNLLRAIPFEPLSALGPSARPWHDRGARTFVIDEEASRIG